MARASGRIAIGGGPAEPSVHAAHPHLAFLTIVEGGRLSTVRYDRVCPFVREQVHAPYATYFSIEEFDAD